MVCDNDTSRSIVLLSSSKERRRILEELGYHCVLPPFFIDAEENEKAVTLEDPDVFSKRVLNAKFEAYSKAGAFRAEGVFLLADTIVYCVADGTIKILGKCTSALQAREFLDLYSRTDRVVVRSSVLIVKSTLKPGSKETALEKSFFSDEAAISLADGKKGNMITESFIEEYMSTADFTGRAGAIECDAFIRLGLEISGNRQTIRGLCPF